MHHIHDAEGDHSNSCWNGKRLEVGGCCWGRVGKRNQRWIRSTRKVADLHKAHDVAADIVRIDPMIRALQPLGAFAPVALVSNPKVDRPITRSPNDEDVIGRISSAYA
jgi:hypothetical protein